MVALFVLVCLVTLVGGVGIGAVAVEKKYDRLAAAEKARALPPAVNVFGDIVLPDPADPRWKRKAGLGCGCDGCGIVMMQFGKVHSCIEHNLNVDGLDLGRAHDRNRTKAYSIAVRNAYAARVAQEEIDATVPFQEEPEPLTISGA